MGAYVADFYCHEARLVVEIDSRFHDGSDAVERDRVRDHWMKSRGVEVVRVRTSDVAKQIEVVLRSIQRAAKNRIEEREKLKRPLRPD
mgnify:CR=1 FL=1